MIVIPSRDFVVPGQTRGQAPGLEGGVQPRGLGEVLHDDSDNDDADVTPQGRLDFVAAHLFIHSSLEGGGQDWTVNGTHHVVVCCRAEQTPERDDRR